MCHLCKDSCAECTKNEDAVNDWDYCESCQDKAEFVEEDCAFCGNVMEIEHGRYVAQDKPPCCSFECMELLVKNDNP